MFRRTLFVCLALLGVAFASPTLMADHSNYATAILSHDTTPVNDKFRQLIRQGAHEALAGYLGDGADPNHADGKGVSAIHYAAYVGDIRAMRLLIQHGADLDNAPFGGWTPMHYAAFAGHLDIINLLAAMGANINARDAGGETPLFYAMESSSNALLTVSELVDHGADINAQNNQHETPVYIAKSHGVDEVVTYLLKRGATDPGSAHPHGKHSHQAH